MKIAIIQPTGEVLRCGEDWGKHLQTFARTGSLDFVEVCWPQPRSNTPSRRTERLDPFKAAKHCQPTSKNRL